MARQSKYTEFGLRLNHWTIHEAASWAVNTTEQIHELDKSSKQDTVADALLSDTIAACDKGEIESIELEKTSFVHPWDFAKWTVEQWIPKREKTRTKRASKGQVGHIQPIRIWVDDPGTAEDYIRERCLAVHIWNSPDTGRLLHKPSWTWKECESLIFGRQIIDDPSLVGEDREYRSDSALDAQIPRDTQIRLDIQSCFRSFFLSAVGYEIQPVIKAGVEHFSVQEIQNWVNKHGIRPGCPIVKATRKSSNHTSKPSPKKSGRPPTYDAKTENKILVEWKKLTAGVRMTHEACLEYWPLDTPRPWYVKTSSDFDKLLQRARGRDRRRS